MWRNTDVLDFVEWLRKHNSSSDADAHPSVGFYGMDVYSLHSSADSVIEYLEEVDPDAELKARRRYGCYAKSVPSCNSDLLFELCHHVCSVKLLCKGYTCQHSYI